LLFSLLRERVIMVITCCPVCGSRNVGTGRISDGVNPREYRRLACRNCGWTGIPIEFTDEQDYNIFLKELKENDEEYDESVFYDPAEQTPLKRYVIRATLASIIYLLLLIIPAIVFYCVSILLDLPDTWGILCAFVSFFAYLYVFWKKELWNLIQR